MDMIDKTTLWTVIAGIGIGSFALRFAFIGLVGDRPLPGWLLRHLRYTAVTVIPALVAPLVIWPPATGGETAPARLAAALARRAGSVSPPVAGGQITSGATSAGITVTAV